MRIMFLYANLGYCNNYLGNYEKALDYFKSASEIDPNEFGYLYSISRISIGLGNYYEALLYINKARELNENNELLDELIEDINNLSDKLLNTFKNPYCPHPYKK